MTQQNKGVVSKIFYNIRKNRVAYLEIKWKRQKDLQFGRLVVVVVVGVVVVVVIVVVVVVVVAKEGKDTQNTQKKKKQRMKTDKKMRKFFTSFWFLTQFNSYISIYTL